MKRSKKHQESIVSQFLVDYKSEINKGSLLVALIIYIVLLIIEYIAFLFIPSGLFWKPNVISIISALSTTVVIFLVWEVGAKRSFTKEVLKLTNLSDNITESGIEYYYDDFKEIEWQPLLHNQKNVVICMTYGKWLFKRIEKDLIELTKNGGKITLYLPDYENEDIVSALAHRFNKEPVDVRKNIETAIGKFSELGADINLFNGTFQTSFYLFEKQALMSFFNHHLDEKGTVPAFVVGENGTLFEFITSEINAIKSRSRQLEVKSEK